MDLDSFGIIYMEFMRTFIEVMMIIKYQISNMRNYQRS